MTSGVRQICATEPDAGTELHKEPAMNKKSKKLTLSSETLRNLDENALKDAQGMVFTDLCTNVTARCTFCTIHCGSACCP
jgi:hypothetical protein